MVGRLVPEQDPNSCSRTWLHPMRKGRGEWVAGVQEAVALVKSSAHEVRRIVEELDLVGVLSELGGSQREMSPDRAVHHCRWTEVEAPQILGDSCWSFF